MGAGGGGTGERSGMKTDISSVWILLVVETAPEWPWWVQ